MFAQLFGLLWFLSVTYWPWTEPSIKKLVHPVEDIGIPPWTVDGAKFGADAYAHRKQVVVKQIYNQVPQTAFVSWSSRQADSQFRAVGVQIAVPVGDKMPAWESACRLRACSHQWPPVEQPSRMRKKCCYGQRNLGSICSSLFSSPTLLSHITNINPFATL